eukprot:CAMPEP_0113934298 /NCGR_PEP_ID=MMETSP1339-20121228/1634_1 /TAXON_ID=94617 /ORGANISM="Fibrocapsa japonica" /LENGTH=211 /DNA_ID=CAMNT_0000936031 /DNA_START=110 /DNA_END=745 /DNA_ORIENTATION=+ /assembly_acc=CAM_ASM_000762
MASSTISLVITLLVLCLAKNVCSAIEDKYYVKFDVQLSDHDTGSFVLEVNPSWAPNGAQRFKELLDDDFFAGCRFFRVIKDFVAQFGIHGNPGVQSQWRDQKIKDDPVTQKNYKGSLTFATSGPDSRTTQLFFNLKDNFFLDSMGFSPFARVVIGQETVDALYSGYGEGAPSGSGPSQALIQQKGNTYLTANFPDLSYIISTTIVDYPDQQ